MQYPRRALSFSRAYGFCLVLLLAVLSINPAQAAQTVERKLSNGKVALATFWAGKPGKPAVIVLHGFLQTREFPTVVNMSEALAGAGYTVIAPTLTLGLSRRKASLACEALHVHKMDDDLKELGVWVRWLERQGHRQIILIGHSFGGLHVLDFATSTPRPNVQKIVVVSMADTESVPDPAARNRLLSDLRKQIARHDSAVVSGPLNYCKRYTGEPIGFLSYLRWNRANILAMLDRVNFPVSIIMGSKDDRMGADWPEKLAAHGIPVRTIEGANHFFDAQYEFELQDAILVAVGATRQ